MRSSATAGIALPTAAIGARTTTASSSTWWHIWRIDPVVVLTVVGRCIGLAAGLIGSVITARYLEPVGRGEYFVVLTTAGLIAQLGNLGLHSGNTYFVARDRGLFSQLLANSVWISFLGVPAMGLLLLMVSAWSTATPAGSTSGLFAIALAPLFVFNLMGNGLFVGLNQMKTFSLMQPMSAVIVLPAILAAALLNCGPTGFLVANVLAWALTILVMLRLLFRQSSDVRRFSVNVMVTTCRYSGKVYAATLAGFVVLRMNVFILNAISGAEQVGYYSVASQVADSIGILPQSIATVLFPRLIASSGAGRLAQTMRDVGRTAVLLALVCGAVWLLATPAINLVFGAEFAPAVPILRALLPAVFLLGVTSVVSQYLAATGFPLSVVVCWLIAAVAGSALSYECVTRFGPVGAGHALSLTYAAVFAGLLFLCWRTASAGAGIRRRGTDE
jgi:O-antigen/teichoic acid export membrane protein